MHLILLLSLYFMYHALGSPSDILYLQKLNADEAQILDRKDFGALANVFTKNATLNVGIGENVYGIEAIQATIAAILPPTNISQFAITTQNYELLPPFDEQGAAGTATGVVYTTAAVIGQGNFPGRR